MTVAVFAMPNSLKSELFGKKDEADTLMSGDSCPEITSACTPGTECASAPTITPTTAGVCRTLRFPNSAATLKDFHATINTAGIAHVAFFTAHMPTEFERDQHYFVSTDHSSWHEPISSLDNDAAHSHRRRLSAVDHGRRLSAGGRKVGRNDRRSQRRLANTGSCCNTAMQQGAWNRHR